MAEQVFLAVDLGASSGRVLAGLFDGQRLRLEEVHRFENGAVALAGSLQWDLLRLWSHVQLGLRRAASQFGGRVRSVGVDTWGVDFGLLGRGDVLLGNPHSYRDRRSQGMLARALQRVPREEIFEQTGLQFMEINTLYQLLGMQAAGSPLLDVAESFLMMPDLFHWLLTGVKVNEVTDATTTQFFDPRQRRWATDLLSQFDLPTHIFGDLAEPGTDLGPLLREVADETGLNNVRVVLPGAHDTASAVMAVPAASTPGQQPDWCYISSGTWSLMGVEVPGPVVTPKCLELAFTNEGGVGNTIRLLKNITGLWLVQECRRVWAQRGVEYTGAEFGWEGLNRLSAAAAPLVSFVDPDHASFLAPTDMPAAIQHYCQQSGQPVPGEVGPIIRCVLESLALRYRQVLADLEQMVGRRVETIHIVGGGTQNRQLCQATADACGRRVLAGPIEATAIGNVMMQAIAAGSVGSIAEAREVVRASFHVEEYLPRDGQAWDEAFGRFSALPR